MGAEIEIVYTDERYVEGFNKVVDIVARERNYLSMTSGFPMESSRWFVNHMVKHKYPQYFLLADGELVGWCDIAPKEIPEFGHVGNLGMGVLAPYRGKGYGKKLLLKTIAHARDVSRLEKVELTVFESNASAMRLYASVGFVVEGKRIKARKIDGRYDNEIEMALFF